MGCYQATNKDLFYEEKERERNCRQEGAVDGNTSRSSRTRGWSLSDVLTSRGHVWEHINMTRSRWNVWSKYERGHGPLSPAACVEEVSRFCCRDPTRYRLTAKRCGLTSIWFVSYSETVRTEQRRRMSKSLRKKEWLELYTCLFLWVYSSCLLWTVEEDINDLPLHLAV